MEKQNRFASKTAWVAVAALVLFILKNYGLLAPLGLTEEAYKQLFDLVMAVLVAFGVFNNPTNSEGF